MLVSECPRRCLEAILEAKQRRNSDNHRVGKEQHDRQFGSLRRMYVHSR